MNDNQIFKSKRERRGSNPQIIIYAGTTGLEPATFRVTGGCSNQVELHSRKDYNFFYIDSEYFKKCDRAKEKVFSDFMQPSAPACRQAGNQVELHSHTPKLAT